MTVMTDRVKAILDNLKGATFTNVRALEIMEDFNDSTAGTPDEKAVLFMESLTEFVRKDVRKHVLRQRKIANDAAEQNAADNAVIDL